MRAAVVEEDSIRSKKKNEQADMKTGFASNRLRWLVGVVCVLCLVFGCCRSVGAPPPPSPPCGTHTYTHAALKTQRERQEAQAAAEGAGNA
jgi:hypothetical protein